MSRTEEGAFGDNMVPSDAHFRTVISSGFLIKEYAYPVYVVPISKQTTNGFLETLSLKKTNIRKISFVIYFCTISNEIEDLVF